MKHIIQLGLNDFTDARMNNPGVQFPDEIVGSRSDAVAVFWDDVKERDFGSISQTGGAEKLE